MAAHRRDRPPRDVASRRAMHRSARRVGTAVMAAAVLAMGVPGAAQAKDVNDGSSPAPAHLAGPPGVPGIDVSAYQHTVDWPAQAAAGIKFAYVLATEGNYASNSYFTGQDDGARAAGLLVGSYHFANPAASTASAQARYFVAHGGGWRADGNTLPPVLDMEDDPYNKDICYLLTPARMVAWIKSYSSEIALLTGRKPVIYTTSKWWNKCTAGSAAFTGQLLFLAKYATTPGHIPRGWSHYTFWQYSEKPPASAPGVVGDLDVFNGTLSALRSLAGPAKPLFSTGPAVNPLFPPMPSPLAATMTQTPLLAATRTPHS
jgi:GH25 family lysozyme M1 (1,4-beta-N-acetylmuramidase)